MTFMQSNFPPYFENHSPASRDGLSKGGHGVIELILHTGKGWSSLRRRRTVCTMTGGFHGGRFTLNRDYSWSMDMKIAKLEYSPLSGDVKHNYFCTPSLID
jgi:hypothetical protein